MTPVDPRWIANWWVGLLGGSGACLLSAIFITGFPRIVKSQKDQCEKYFGNLEKPKQTYLELDFKKNLKDKFHEFLAILKDLLTNWSFVFNCMAVNTSLMYSEGIAPFIAKVLILQYGVQPEKVGNALTLSALPTMISMSLFILAVAVVVLLCYYYYLNQYLILSAMF